MTDHRIRPSTTKKTATAIRKTIVYRSRMAAPWVVTATGGYSPVTNVSPYLMTSTPTAIATTTAISTRAPMAIAVSATVEGRVLGGLDINVLEDGRTDWDAGDR